MSVYFAKVGRYIKVGYSANPDRRVANLFKSTTRYGAPKDIDASTPRTLLGHIPGDVADEHRAHVALNDFRVFGEWFLDESEARVYIDGCLAVGAVLACYVSRPAGDYRWDEDPTLMPTHLEREFELHGVQHIFDGAWMPRAHSP